MTTQLHDTGEEFLIKYLFTDEVIKPANVTVGLYDDSTDLLADADDYVAITSEPSTGNYATQTVSFDGTGFNSSQSGGNWRATNASTVTFDVQNTTETVDSYYVLVNFDDGGGAADHLFWTGDLEQSRDLSQIDTLDVNTFGASVT